jgi:hypothetical protein
MLRALIVCAAALSLHAATPLYQTSIDKPQDYTVIRGVARPDTTIVHDSGKSLRVEPGKTGDGAIVRFSPVSLTMGKRYELSGWVRSDNLEVRDVDRSPIAIGATLSMASMPFDVHSASLGGTQPWTRLSLRFVASRTQDQIQLSVANGGAFKGAAWFQGVSLDEVGAQDAWPAREAVQTFGPAYRYPAAGWIYLHIEGQPYERGYQHGHLMAREIPEYLARCAAELGSAEQWNEYRTMANALFLRGFDREILEEMRGIAEGAADAGAKWMNRRVDLIDMLVANVTVEMGLLRSAVSVTPTGLEDFTFNKPAYTAKKDSVLDHCSAFAATGPATRDGKMVIGHVTWWPLTLAEQTNVWLDVKPAAGHRVLMQSYPGGIESGTDWYQNDAGVILTETTIRQTPFNAQGTPVAFRARQAIQYGGSIDEVIQHLGARNNGLYTNEWLLGDAKTNEIAMYELGTNHTKLWRSSKSEWFGNTPGFYWGDNNAKDLAVRLETQPDPHGAPEYIPYVAMPRDLAWQELYKQHKGQIDEQFAFLAFRTAPLVAATTMDAKVITADMANKMMVWAAMGKPNQREWLPGGRSSYANNDGLYSSGYHLFDTTAPPAGAPEKATPKVQRPQPAVSETRLWKGWVLPASEADTWFVAGSAAYRRLLASEDTDKSVDAARITWRGLKLAPPTQITRQGIEQARGIFFLDALRHKLGDDPFFKLMSDYFAANTTKTVTAQSFLDKAGVPFDVADPGDGPAYLTTDIGRRLAGAIIVYGTNRDAGANRYAAEQMQTRFLDQLESKVAIYKDFEVNDQLLREHDVIFVGRPEANSALAAWSGKLGLKYDGAMFEIDGVRHASEREALLLAAKNPLDPARMVLVVAGNDALRTVKALRAQAPAPYAIFEDRAPGPSSGRNNRSSR